MKIENNKVVLEYKDCWSCAFQKVKGTQPGHKPCPQCKGTMDGPRGGKGTCRYNGTEGTCYRGSVIDWSQKLPCDNCGGDWEKSQLETWTDSIKGELLLAHLRVQLYRSDREQTWAEHNLGAGFWSITDYGAHRKLSDAEFMNTVIGKLSEDNISVCKFVVSKDDLSLPDHIGIFTSNQGYFPAAVFTDGTVRIH